MADDLPSIKPTEVLRALERAGFVELRRKGSHRMLRHPESGRFTIIALHNRDMSRAMLAAVLKQAGLTTEEFLALLRKT